MMIINRVSFLLCNNRGLVGISKQFSATWHGGNQELLDMYNLSSKVGVRLYRTDLRKQLYGGHFPKLLYVYASAATVMQEP